MRVLTFILQPYVHLKYIPVTGQKKYCDMMRDLSGALDKNKQVSPGGMDRLVLGGCA